jgi:hypothetical protein
VKGPSKVKLDVVKSPAGLIFVDRIAGKDSIYVRKLQEALASSSVIQISAGDSYMRSQLRIAAKKIKARLVFVEGESQRLMVLLREPRTLSELEAKRFELRLSATLAEFAKNGIAHELRGKWVLTEKGMDAL